MPTDCCTCHLAELSAKLELAGESCADCVHNVGSRSLQLTERETPFALMAEQLVEVELALRTQNKVSAVTAPENT